MLQPQGLKFLFSFWSFGRVPCQDVQKTFDSSRIFNLMTLTNLLVAAPSVVGPSLRKCIEKFPLKPLPACSLLCLSAILTGLLNLDASIDRLSPEMPRYRAPTHHLLPRSLLLFFGNRFKEPVPKWMFPQNSFYRQGSSIFVP